MQQCLCVNLMLNKYKNTLILTLNHEHGISGGDHFFYPLGRKKFKVLVRIWENVHTHMVVGV